MLPYAIAATILGVGVSILGLSMMVHSLVSASRRGQPIRGRFLAPTESFIGDEVLYNRRGFWLCVLGLAILCVPIYLLA